MSKLNLIVDDGITGQSATVRKRSWLGTNTASRFLGHPSMKKAYGPRGLDRFRGSGARYYGWAIGGYGPNYADFKYLNHSDAEGRGTNESNLVGFQIDNINTTPAAFSSNVRSVYIGGSGGSQYSDMLLAPESLGQYFGASMALTIMPAPYVVGGNTYPHRFNQEAGENRPLSVEIGVMIETDSLSWVAGSIEQGISGPGTANDDPRFNFQAPNTWRVYAGGDNFSTDGWAKLPESLPAGAYPGFLPPSAQTYYDHAHTFISPVADGASGPGIKVASIEGVYYRFHKTYETAIAGLDERLLPNPYILFDAVDAGPANAAPGTDPISDRVLELYKTVSCFHGSFRLPSTRDQIATSPNIPTDSAQPGYGEENRTYLQQYAAAAASLDLTDPNLQEVMDRTSHIAYGRDFVANNFVDYNSQVNLPFGINIEFDTRMSDNAQLARRIDEIPGAYDFLLQNIMMMNISDTPDSLEYTYGAVGWNSLIHGNPADTSGERVRFLRGEDLFGVSGSFHGVIKDLDADTIAHYGFDRDSWGQHKSALGGPWENQGSYDLKMLDLSAAMAYAWSVVKGTGNRAQIQHAPSPILGPTTTTGVAFGKGMFVGRRQLVPAGQPHFPCGGLFNNNLDLTVMDEGGFADLCNKLAEVIHNQRRTYKEVLEGELAYCETLAFRIAKHKVNPDGSVAPHPVQNFYLPNVYQTTPGDDDTVMTKLKYIDTQVHYGQKYVYKVYAYNLVVGDEYNYKSAGRDNVPAQYGPSTVEELTDATEDDQLYMKVNHFTSVKIIEAPYYTYEPMEVRDLPPVFPEVEVVPFRGVNNKIRLLLQTQGVKYAFNPDSYLINEADADNYNLQRTFQGRPTGALVFGSDDTEIVFEIYRTTERPTSYRSFEGKMLASVPGLTPSGARTVNVGYDDTIQPNTKYYYTFRTIDYHGSLSIPAPIYEVEIVDDNGRMYPAIQVMYLDSSPARSAETTMAFRRYLHISPTLPQSAVNQEELTSRESTLSSGDAPGTGLLGVLSDGVWTSEATAVDPNPPQRIFKIRLTSKQTGKKMDLNVKFIETSSPNPDEAD